MRKVKQNENVVSWVELISDESLLKDWNRAYFKAFKNWSWNLAWHNKYAWRFFLISLITWTFWMIASFFDAWLSALIWMEDGYSISLFSSIVSIVFWVGLLWFSLNIARWKKQIVDDLFREITRSRVWKNLIWGLLYGLIVFGWFMLLLIPWIIFWVRFQFFAYAVVDKWLWPIDALKYSWRITKWRFWEIVWFDCYFILINILWFLCLVIWAVWTVAMTNMASARYYRLISNIYEKNLTVAQNVKK